MLCQFPKFKSFIEISTFFQCVTSPPWETQRASHLVHQLPIFALPFFGAGGFNTRELGRNQPKLQPWSGPSICCVKRNGSDACPSEWAWTKARPSRRDVFFMTMKDRIKFFRVNPKHVKTISQTSDSKQDIQIAHRPRWFGRTCAAETGTDFGARDDWFRSSTTLQIKRGWVGFRVVWRMLDYNFRWLFNVV